MNPYILLLPSVAMAATTLLIYMSVRLRPGSADRLRARRAEQPLAHELPYWAFLDDADRGIVVNVDGTYSTALELTGLDTDCLDAESLNQISQSLHGVLQGLPAGAVLQCLYWTDSDVADLVRSYRAQEASAHPLGKLLVENKSDLLLHAHGLRRSRLVAVLSLPPAGMSSAVARWRTMLRGTKAVTQAQHEDACKRIRGLADQVGRGLLGTGVRVGPLSAAALRRLAYEFLNPRRSRVVTEPAGSQPWADDQTAREQLLCSGLLENATSLVHDGQLVRVLTLKALPTWTEPALLESLAVSVPFHCRIQVAVELADDLKALDDLKRRRDQAHLLATLREKRNQEAEAQEHDVAELIDRNLRSSVRMVRLALTVVLSVDAALPDADQILDSQTQEVIRLAGSLHGAQLMVDEYAQLDELLATLPGHARHSRRFRRCTSENASHLLLVWQSWTGSPRPPLLLENARGHLVGLDPFDDRLDNPNAFMAGSSGSGKSVTTNFLLLNLLASGAKALVGDVGGSYRRLIDLLGGHYFSFTLDRHADQALNLFFAPDDIVGEDGSLDSRRAQFVLAVLERMLCDARRPELGNAERAVLSQSVEETYRRTAGRTPILSDLSEVLSGYRGADPEEVALARSLARDLRIWVEGPAARLVNRPSTFALATDLAAFDLKGLEGDPHLQSVVLLIISGVIWNLVMRDPSARKVVVFDEVWRFLELPSSARLVAELYRTSRKYAASILTISQAVADFTGSSIATALTNNSATVYLLKHHRGHDTAADLFHLNAREQHIFRELEMRRGQFTEVLVLHGDHHFLGRVVLSPLEYWIATTHRKDLKVERDLQQSQPHLSRLDLLRLLAARYPTGAADADDDEPEVLEETVAC